MSVFLQRLARVAIAACAFANLSRAVTIVETDADVSFAWPGDSTPTALRSNPVVATMRPSLAFTLMDDWNLRLPHGTSAEFAHRLLNRSATPLRFSLTARNQSADGYDLSGLTLYADANANGRLDPGEREITSETVLTLPPGEQLHLVACGTVPMGTAAEATANVVVLVKHLDGDGMMVRVNTVAAREHEGAGLLVEKTASRREAEIGETVDYTVRIRNAVGATLPAVVLEDRLPAGFTFVPGSLRRDGEPMADPIASGSFALPLGPLAAEGTTTLRYRAVIGPNALGGDGINRAQAVASGYASNTASVRVKVRDGVFTDKGIVLGRVFLDRNGDGRPQPDEPGVPDVRLYLENGAYAVTEVDGKYSFYGLAPRLHVLKPDPLTLPRGATLAASSTRDAGDGGLRFIDLKRYELHQANLPLAAESSDVLAEIETRRARSRGTEGELSEQLDARLSPDGQPAPVADVKALPASGVIAPRERSNVIPRSVAHVAADSASPLASTALAADLAALDAQPGFVDLHEGDVLPVAQTDVRVKGPAGARFSLAVNGRLIGSDQVGSVALVGAGVEIWTFVGVALVAGENRLRLLVADPFGNPREGAALRVVAPGALAQIKLTVPTDARADAGTIATIGVTLQDARGVPVTTRTPLTLQATLGRWQVEDLDPQQPGWQVFVEGGRAAFALVPPVEPGESAVSATSGSIRADATFAFAPNLRPLLAAGVVEGVIHLGSGGGWLRPASSRDGFEEELRAWSAVGDDGRLGAGARAAFFLKGKVRGDYLLTAAYDSEKDESNKLFRDIQPGEYYPVYGDASVRGYDAQSTGRLFVRIDKNRSYLLVGDFTTEPADPDAARSLSAYQRSLNGAKKHFESGGLSLNAWASQDSSRQIVEEVPANGTSGPYQFKRGEVRVNSERVEVLTRDRDQPARIVATRTLVRFFDYEFEPFTGRLLLRAPLRSLDADLNPVSLRVTYEVDAGGAAFWTYGADARYRLTEGLTLSGSYARDENPADTYALAGLGAHWQLGPRTTLAAELAQSESTESGAGLAGRAEFRHRDEKTDARIFYGETDPQFRNPAALLLPGRIEAGFKATRKLRPTTSLVAQGLLTEDVARDARRHGVRVDVAESVGAWRFEVGARHSEQTAAAPGGSTRPSSGPRTVDSLRGRITAPWPRLPGATVYGEYERDIAHSRRELAAVGFDATLRRGGRAYGRHEFITSLGGAFELNEVERNHHTIVGLETGYMKDGQLFNEYRAGQELYGREAEAALGLRNLFTLADGVRLNTSFERVTPVSGERRNESTALAGAIEFERVRWRANARLELRDSTSTDSLLNTLGYARRLNEEWTFLGKSILLLTETRGAAGGEARQTRVQAGFAWRPARDDRWTVLGKYEVRYESDDRLAAGVSRRLIHILAADAAFTSRAGWTVSGHYAGKLTAEDGLSAGTAHLVGGRWRKEFARRWDAGLNSWVFFAGDGGQWRYACGPEAGVTLQKNLRLGVGFNLVGFHDRDLASDGTTARGVFVRLAFKFDERLLRVWERKGTP